MEEHERLGRRNDSRVAQIGGRGDEAAGGGARGVLRARMVDLVPELSGRLDEVGNLEETEPLPAPVELLDGPEREELEGVCGDIHPPLQDRN